MSPDETVPTVTAPDKCNVVIDRDAKRVFVDIDYVIRDLDDFLTLDEGYAAQLADAEWLANCKAQREVIDHLKVSAISLHMENGI